MSLLGMLLVSDVELVVAYVERDIVIDCEMLDKSVVGDDVGLPIMLLGKEGEEGEGVLSGQVSVGML